MKRISIGEGKWFDVDTATAFEDDRTKKAIMGIGGDLGSTEIQTLYRTAKDRVWILRRWTIDGTKNAFVIITDDEATRWLIDNGHLDDLPPETLAQGEV